MLMVLILAGLFLILCVAGWWLYWLRRRDEAREILREQRESQKRPR